MDTSIKPRKAEPAPSISRVRLVDYSEETPRVTFDCKLPMTPEKLDELDAIAARLIETDRCHIFMSLTLAERIYIALAANNPYLLTYLSLTIPEAIDRLGWVDASAMVARWRNRRA